jgi:Flp pilus assembly protein TadD
MTLGRNNEALAAFDQAVGFNPINSFAWKNRAEVLDRMGRTAEANESRCRVMGV